jgi:2-polyprenyl-6-methoxyphenol hydroxylase-like FAD-dependent oxidoreductase
LKKKCIDIRTKEIVQALCADGSIHEFDLLIAADGLHSAARKHVAPQKKMRHSGQTCYRGIATLALPPLYRSAYIEFVGNNLRFGIADLSADRTYWYAVEVVEKGFEDRQTDRRSRLLELFSSFPQEVIRCITETSEIHRNDMYDLAPSSDKWYTDKICLIGDAAHATTPNLAQGACQALEDAYTLVVCLAKAKEARQAFASYQSLRQSKSDFLVNQSWGYGQMMHTRYRVQEEIWMKILSITPDKYFASQLNFINNLDYLKSW